MESKKRTLNEKLLEFQNSVDTIKKDATNPHFKNSYASLPNILSAVKPILNALRLVLTQPVTDTHVKTIITDCDSEAKIESILAIPAGLSAQQVGSAITYYRRYTLSSLLALEIDEDDDGNSASQPTDSREWLNKYTDKNKTAETENWKNVCAALTNGGFTIGQVESKYKLSAAVKAELINIQNGNL